MDVTALMTQPRKMNVHYTSKDLTNAIIFPESDEQPNLDIVNQQELWRAGIFLNQYDMRFSDNFLNNYDWKPGKMKTKTNWHKKLLERESMHRVTNWVWFAWCLKISFSFNLTR